MTSVAVRTVRTSADLRTFIDVPFRLFGDSSHRQWVPPLRRSVRRILDPDVNPFFENADARLFLAERKGRPVGRIAAIDNRWHTEYHEENVGFFGYFETVEDPDVAAALFDAAEGWAREGGRESLRGPTNPSSNYEIGLLVDGFEHIPTFMTPWNPPYYARLMEGLGYEGCMDLFGWRLDVSRVDEEMHRRFQLLTRRLVRKRNISLDTLDMSRFDEELTRAWRVYQEAWGENWGFCPVTREEFLFIARELKPLIVPDGGITVSTPEEMVGFTLVLPDYNRGLIHNRKGRLFPLGWLRLIRARRHPTWVRCMLTGVTRAHQKTGVVGLLLYEAIKKAPDFGVENVEFSWTLENNTDANRALDNGGAEVYRTWRMYERRLTPPTTS